METVFQVCLSNTIGAVFLAAAATAAGAFGRRPALAHFLWVLVLIKLLTPPLFHVPLWHAQRGSPAPRAGGLGGGLAPAADGAGAAAAAARRGSPSSESAPGDEATPSADSARPSLLPALAGNLLGTVASHTPASSYPLALAAWLGVSGCWWIQATRRARAFRRLLRWASVAPADVQDRAAELARQFGLRRAPRVWFVPAPISPMLWTLGGRPRLLFPGTLWGRLNAEQRTTLLAHEMAHLKRRDHWVRLLEIAVTGLYWWNPLVWWARRALRDAEERCCDAWVVRAFPDRARAYASAIIETLDCLADVTEPEPIGATGLVSASRLKRRLTEILGSSATRELSRPTAIALLALATAALALGPAYVAPRSYKVMDIGTLGGQSVTGFRLNNHGQVAGWSDVVDPRDPAGRRLVRHPFRTAPDRPIDPAADDLANLIRANEPAELLHYGAYDINNKGQVIVSAQGNWSLSARGGPPFDRGFLIDGDRVVELAPGLDPRLTAINDSGQVAGLFRKLRRGPRRSGREPFQIREEDTDWIAFRANTHAPIAPARDGLGQPWGRTANGLLYSTATDMNALGQVVGEAVTKSGMAHAFRTAPGRPIDPTTDDLGTLAGPGGDAAGRGMSRARAVNDLGQVAGVASLRAGSYQHAFRTAPNRPIDAATDDLGTLGGLNSEAYGINNRGEVVGQSDIPPDPRRTPTHAFIYTETRMIDLNSLVELEPGWVLVRAFDINDRGQIAAAARIDSADSGPAAQRAYLLTPAPAIAPLAMLVLGSAVTASGMAVSRRRRAVDRARAQS